MEEVEGTMRAVKRLSVPGLVCMLIGLLLIGYPIYGWLSTRIAVNQMEKQWEASRNRIELPDTEAGMKPVPLSAQAAAIGNPSEGHPPTPTSVSIPDAAAANSSKVAQDAKPSPIGQITIPRIDLTAPIAEGVDTATMRYAIGHLKGSAALGAPGNCVLAGHRSYTYGQFFNRLGEVKLGDPLILETRSEDVTYKVTDIQVVEPTDLSVLDDTSPKATLTLITCTPQYSSRYRLIVKAQLESRKPIS